MSNRNITSSPAESNKLAHLVGGFTGGIVATFSLHPFEVLKTRFAVNDGSNLIKHKYTGIGNALRVIYKTNGIRGFYQGVSPNLIGSGISWGMFLYLYEKFKSGLSQGGEATLNNQLTAACLSGVTTLTLTNPIWVVKTRMILQSDTATNSSYYRNVFDGLSKIWRGEGIRGLYRGYLAGVIGVSHGVVQIVSYDRLKSIYRQCYVATGDTPWYVYLSLSAASKVFAVTSTYPYLVVPYQLLLTAKKYSWFLLPSLHVSVSRLVRSGFRNSEPSHDLYKGVIQTTVLTARNEGIRGFYKGMLPSLLRLTPATDHNTKYSYTNTQCLLQATQDKRFIPVVLNSP